MLVRSMAITRLLLTSILECLVTRAETTLPSMGSTTISAGRDSAILGRSGCNRTLLVPVYTLHLELLTRLTAATASRAARADLKNESDQTERRSDPHKHQHLGADMRLDVDARVGV